MKTSRELFDRSDLTIDSLDTRQHDLDISIIKDIESTILPSDSQSKTVTEIAKRMILAKKNGAAIIMMMGAHVIRDGVQKYLVDLMARGYISCTAMNGACMIHDFEFALVGATTESVAHYIKSGQFGLWKETGILNDIINRAYREDKDAGMGRVVGEAIATGDFPHAEVSLLAAGFRLEVPITIHVAIGQDIIHQHPNCDGAATGALTYNDFLKFVSNVQNLQHGVVINFGSAVMAPEVFLKALSMARNVARQKRKVIRNFATLVCDLHDIPANILEEPPKDEAAYYFRPWKTMLSRTVADGGESFYMRGRHSVTIPSLWLAINKLENGFESG
jgi:hypothetical protein